MSRFLSHIHAEIRRARITKRGASLPEDQVPVGLHKTYPRMARIELPKPAATGMQLEGALAARRSRRAETPGISLTEADWGTLLGHGIGAHSDARSRTYPSGGRLFPIETYIVSTGIGSYGPGIFHYNPSLHALEYLWPLPVGFDLKQLARKPESLLFSALIVFTSVWERSGAKYGDLSYSHALLEAGHMSENLLLVATALGLSTCPMAGFNDELLSSLIDLDTADEQPVHTITISKHTDTAPTTGKIVE